ncbi:MAG TPA: carbohydrate kinase family protein [Candidatus Limnocylindrales bacterium]|nr:carbohydrate kinase family protein [Candidatus Limnocylindrales bacterium]
MSEAAAVPAAAPGSLLLGAASLDIYLGRELVLPGGGVLNMAWHLREEADPWHLLTRIGDDRPAAFLEFLARHGIAYSAGSIVGRGPSASIDIAIQPDLQPHMDNFVEGVWASYRATVAEERLIAGARRLHLVLVEGAIRELDRLAASGLPGQLEVSADFLGFRHYTVDRFASTMRAVDVGFVGWPGALDNPVVAGLRGVAHDLGRLVVVTLGSRGIQVFDGRPGGEDRFLPVVPVEVRGTTVGCGDAFVAAFLRAWRRTPDVLAAVEAGKVAGAAATAWRRPLPDGAYGPEAAEALRAADEAATAAG